MMRPWALGQKQGGSVPRAEGSRGLRAASSSVFAAGLGTQTSAWARKGLCACLLDEFVQGEAFLLGGM